MDIVVYLLKLLNLKKEIGIDNLGTFYKKKNPGRYDAQTHRFLPPSYSLCFTAEVKETKNLALEITKDRHVSLATANYFILQFATEVAKGLSDKGSYELEEIGTLINKNGQIEFIPEHPDEFGFDFFALPSVNSEISLPVTSSTEPYDNLDFEEPETAAVQAPVVAEKNIGYQFYIETVTPESVAEELEKENEQKEEPLHPSEPLQDEPSLGFEPDATEAHGIKVSEEEPLPPVEPHQDEPSLGFEPDATEAHGIKVSEEEPLPPSEPLQDEPSLGFEPDATEAHGIKVSEEEPLYPVEPHQDEPSLGFEPDATEAHGIKVSEEEPLHLGEPHQDEPSLGFEPDATEEHGIKVSEEEPLHLGEPHQDEPSLGFEPDATEEHGIKVSEEEPLHHSEPHQVYQEEPLLRAAETDTPKNHAIEDNLSVTTENDALIKSSWETGSTNENSENKKGVSWLTKLLIVLFCLVVLGLILYMINPSFYDSLFGNNTNKNKAVLPLDGNDGLNNMQDSLNFADSIMMTAEKVGLEVKKAKDTMKLTIKTQEASATTYEIISVAYDSQKKVDQYIERMKKRGIVAKPVSNMPGRMIKVSIATYNDREAARKDLFKLKKELKNSSLYIYVNKNKE